MQLKMLEKWLNATLRLHTEAFLTKEIIVEENKLKSLMPGSKTFAITGMKIKTTVQNETMTNSHCIVYKTSILLQNIFVFLSLQIYFVQ